MAIPIKTAVGFPYLGVKTRDGLVKASLKSWDGVQDTAIPPPSWWLLAGTCHVAYQPKGAASLAASYVNLANPGVNDVIVGTAPGWNATTGWQFTYTTGNAFLKAGSINFSVDDTVIIQYTGENAGLFRTMIGLFTGTGWMAIGTPHVARGYVNFISTLNECIGTLPSGSGNACIAAGKSYSNGVFDVNLTRDAVFTPGVVGIGDGNNAGAPGGRPGEYNCTAYGHFAGTLNATQVATIAAAMAAL